ncbi:MAG: flagellar basal body rod protein FlgB [Elstera sp.]
MSDGKTNLMQLMARRMDYLGDRHKVLAQNVANADTPNYRPSDLRQQNFLQAMKEANSRQPLAMTQPNHLAPVSPQTKFAVDKEKKPYETSLDKNGVVLEEQMMKMAGNQSDYTLNAELYNKYTAMSKMVLRGGQ